MKVFVINLRESVSRRDSIERQFASLDVDFRIFNAIDAHGCWDFFDSYDERKYFANTGRAASLGEVACYASHLSLWRLAVSLDEPIVVMEDDARLCEDFAASLAAAQQLIEYYGLIRLQTDGPTRKTKKRPVRELGDFSLHYYEKYPYGAMAYAISPAVAASWIDKSKVLTGPVDQFIKQYWVHQQPLFGLNPHSVEGGPLRHESTISDRSKQKVSLRLRSMRLASKVRDALGRVAFNRTNNY